MGRPCSFALQSRTLHALVQVPELKAVLRSRGMRYPQGQKKAELVELVRWAEGLAESAPGAPAAAQSTAPAPDGTAQAADASQAAAVVSPEVYKWDDAALAATNAAPSANKPAKMAAVAASGTSMAARFAAGAFDDTEPVVPGIRQFETVATAEEAAIEKEAAGENRAVEHVALHEDPTAPEGLGPMTGNAALGDALRGTGPPGTAKPVAPAKKQAKAGKASKGHKLPEVQSDAGRDDADAANESAHGKRKRAAVASAAQPANSKSAAKASKRDAVKGAKQQSKADVDVAGQGDGSGFGLDGRPLQKVAGNRSNDDAKSQVASKRKSAAEVAADAGITFRQRKRTKQ